MPMGDLREPVGALRRAGALLITNSGALDGEGYARLVRGLSALAPDARVFRGEHAAVCFVECGPEPSERPLDWVAGRSIAAFCGIGRPASLFDMLESLGAVVRERIVFPDHHAYSESDLVRVAGARAEVVVTTEKDLARLGWTTGIDKICALRIRMQFEEKSEFAQYLSSRTYPAHKKAGAEKATA